MDSKNEKTTIDSCSDNTKKILAEETIFAVDNLSDTSLEHLVFMIRMIIHEIEKNLVKGNDKIVNSKKLKELLEYTQKVISLYPDYPKNGDVIVESLGIIQTFIEKEPDEQEFKSIKDEFINQNGLQNIDCRAIRIIRDKKANHETGVLDWDDYNTFIRCRHSIREFSSKSVDFDLVREIVRTAQICPSECNRQTCKVYYSQDCEKSTKYRPDPMVTKDIYNFLIVTVNKSMYSSHEVLQPWIDGGIFLESLVLAIHAKGLGSCLFQQIKETELYNNIKENAGISENEDIVALIGFGYLLDDFPVVETHRKDVDEVLVKY